MSEASNVQSVEGAPHSEINELDSEFLASLPDNSSASETLEEEVKCCGEANCVERGLHPPGQPEKMNMVAEGYYATKIAYKKNKELPLSARTPIINTVYDILYNKKLPKRAFKELSDKLN